VWSGIRPRHTTPTAEAAGTAGISRDHLTSTEPDGSSPSLVSGAARAGLAEAIWLKGLLLVYWRELWG